MKIRRITSVIILFIMLCVSLGSLTGCGTEAETERVESIDKETGTEEEAQEKDIDTLREELRSSVLQVFCGDYRGSGIVWEITAEEVTVISNAHLLKNGETCRVLCYAGVYYEAKVSRILEGCDIGFAVFPIEELKEDGVILKAAVQSDRGKEELVQGEELVIYGSMDSVAENFVEGYLIEAEREMELPGYDGAQPLMLGGLVKGSENEGKGKSAVDAGMSGSGIFDRTGKLIGILTGGDGESGFAAVPVWLFKDLYN